MNDLVDLDRVRSLLKAIYYRRQFRTQRETAQRKTMFDTKIPAIIVDELPKPPPSTWDITTADRDSMGFFNANSTPPSPSPHQSPEMSFALETPSRRGRGLQRHRRVSDSSMLSTDLGYEYPYVPFLLPFPTWCANERIEWTTAATRASSRATTNRSCSLCGEVRARNPFPSSPSLTYFFTSRNDARSSRRARLLPRTLPLIASFMPCHDLSLPFFHQSFL